MVPTDKCHLAAVAPREVGLLVLLNIERSCISFKKMQRPGPWLGLPGPRHCLHLVLMTSHHLVLQTHPVTQGLS